MHPPASLIQPLWMLAGYQQAAKYGELTQHLLRPPPEPEEWADGPTIPPISYTNTGTDIRTVGEFW